MILFKDCDCDDMKWNVRIYTNTEKKVFWNAELQLRREISYSAIFKVHNITLPNKVPFLHWYTILALIP